jgi:superfamily II DNA or RNA helicase
LFNEEPKLDKTNDKYSYFDNPIMIKSLPRDEVQKEALRFILGEGEYSYTKNKSQLSVNLNTGAGKTYLTVAAIAYWCIRTAIITNSIGWLEQWNKRLIEYTDMKEDEIYLISGSGSIARLLNGMKDLSKIKVYLISHDTIKSYGDKYGWDKVTELFKLLEIGLKVYDEAHLYFDNICRIDYYTNTYKTIYLTATPARSDREENDIYQLYFKNVPSIDLFDEDKDPHTQYIAIHYNSHPTPMNVSKCRNKYGLDRMSYVNYVVEQDSFHKMLHVCMDIINKVFGKVLVYIGTNRSIDIVKEWIEYNYPEYKYKIGVYTSTVKENKKNQLDRKIILSTTKSCGAAIDIKGLNMTIVLAEPFKSEVLARQTLGRTRDDDTFYIEIVDNGFVQIKRYYNEKKPIFAKYATKCSDIKLTDNDLDTKCNKIIEERSKLIPLVTHYDPDGEKLKPLVKWRVAN